MKTMWTFAGDVGDDERRLQVPVPPVGGGVGADGRPDAVGADRAAATQLSSSDADLPLFHG